jgi:alpha-L-rhamnosidase
MKALVLLAVVNGWITHPEATTTPVVLHFERQLTLEEVPPRLPVAVTADNRFVLYVNARRVGSGPSTGTIDQWRQSNLDLAPHLRAGENRITAIVWNFGELAPAAQQSVATGFRLLGAHISTDQAGWRVRIDAGHSAVSGREQIPWTYYVASTPEIIDVARSRTSQWRDAVPSPEGSRRTVIDDPLPPQLHALAEPGEVVRSSRAELRGFPRAAVTIPAHSTAKLLLRRQVMICAYPELEVMGGRGARIRVQYGEALYDADGNKGDRDLVADRQLRGFHDTFLPDGGHQTFAPLWWRTFRYVEIDVTTRDEPVTLAGWRLHETGFPFAQVGSFRSDDAALDRIWETGWRTLRVDAHETYMDSSYWEQLQYAGDTRLQMLITYAVSGDTRLARQAIDAFASSDVAGGIMQGAYPSRLDNVIATFSLAWIGMLHDWLREQPDREVVARHLPRMRRALAWFEPYLNPQGLLGKSPHWNFIDWAGQEWDDRDRFPSWGRTNGSCLMTALWLGALQQGAALERSLGEARQAREMSAKATRARQAIRSHCWDAERGLFADDADLQVFSQHMNVLAVIHDIARREEMVAILERVTVRGKGIAAPPGMYSSTHYFAWHLVRAFEHAGLSDRYFELLQAWRELLPLNYTTWPESGAQPRSDTHAWTAHPTADLLGLVAGIRPAADGYRRLRIAPVLGDLTSLDATAATPLGPVSVRYRRSAGTLLAVIRRPAALPGEFIWRGKSYRLRGETTKLVLRDD